MRRTIPFQHESATVRVVVWGDGEAVVSSLYSQSRNQGHATELLKKVVQFADENGLKLVLEARRFGHPIGPDNAYLEQFYRRFGFVREPGYGTIIFMVRQPISKEQSNEQEASHR